MTLEVLDINDSPPVFVSNLYIFSVPENTTLTGPIGSVEATDEDIGKHETVNIKVHSYQVSQEVTRFYQFMQNSSFVSIVIVINLQSVKMPLEL